MKISVLARMAWIGSEGFPFECQGLQNPQTRGAHSGDFPLSFAGIPDHFQCLS